MNEAATVWPTSIDAGEHDAIDGRADDGFFEVALEGADLGLGAGDGGLGAFEIRLGAGNGGARGFHGGARRGLAAAELVEFLLAGAARPWLSSQGGLGLADPGLGGEQRGAAALGLLVELGGVELGEWLAFFHRVVGVDVDLLRRCRRARCR